MYFYLLPFILLLFTGCAPKAEIDYDPVYQTKVLTTFAIVHKSKTGYESLNEERIKEAITAELQRKDYAAAAQETADFHVAFSSVTQEDVPSNFSFGFGLGTFSRGLGTSVGTSHRASSDEVKMLITMLDPKTQKVFWRTELSKKLPEFTSPQQRSDYFNETVVEMLKEFPAKSAQ
ncbi:MAG: DUF4136 domain-containing protein [Campylobacterales bacterium]|nr:DUF4136 domain-containing protein [Campylobacterales bacterium]